MTQSDFETDIAEKGWHHSPGALNKDQTQALSEAIDHVYDIQRQIQEDNGVADGLNGAVHCIIGYEKTLDDFLTHLPLREEIAAFFGKPYILNNYGGIINFPGNQNYAHNPHRDVRDFTYPVRLMMNMLVMLDDFTVENGATHVLEGSHKRMAQDEKDIFAKHSTQLTGKAGDILLWDSNLLHAAGHNTTNKTRRALTLCFSRPYIKPTIDFLTALEPEFIKAQSPFVQQLLGATARPSKNVAEFFQPAEHWTYTIK